MSLEYSETHLSASNWKLQIGAGVCQCGLCINSKAGHEVSPRGRDCWEVGKDTIPQRF